MAKSIEFSFCRLGERLWRTPGDDLAVAQLTNLWRSTLSKTGCSPLMRSGRSTLPISQNPPISLF